MGAGRQNAMASNSGLVSITIPFYNAERFLRETIMSVFAQTYTQWELLLVDDGSVDRSSQIARGFAQEYPGKVRCLEHPDHNNLGVNAARNLGAQNSRGEFLAFLDSDDIWLPGKLEASVASLMEHPEAGFLFGSTEWWYEWDPEGNGHKKNHIPAQAPGDKVYFPPVLLTQSYPLGPYGSPCPGSFLLRRWAFERVGGFEECFNPTTYQMYEDIAFLSKMYLQIPIYVSSTCLDRNRCNRFSMTRQPAAARSEDAARRFYFRWLISYLRQQAVSDPAIWRAVRKESWFYTMPLPAAKIFRRVQRKMSRSWKARTRWKAAATV